MNTEKQINFVKSLFPLLSCPRSFSYAYARETEAQCYISNLLFLHSTKIAATKHQRQLYIHWHIFVSALVLFRFMSFSVKQIEWTACKKRYTNEVWHDLCAALRGGWALVPRWLETYPFVCSAREGQKESRNGEGRRNKVVWMIKSDLRKRWQERGLRGGREDPSRGEDVAKRVRDGGE